MILAAVAQLLSAALPKLMTLCAGYGLMSLSRILPLSVCELNLNYLYGCISLWIASSFAAGLLVGTEGKKSAA